MNQETITVKELILGLRKEYLEHDAKLRALKKLCDMDEKRATDFRFIVHAKQGDKNPTITCQYKRKLSKLEEQIAKVRSRYGFYKPEPIVNLVTDHNKYYFYTTNSTPWPVHINNQREFSEGVQDILNSPFINHINNTAESSLTSKDNESTISVRQDSIRINTHILGQMTRFDLRYRPPHWDIRDRLYIQSSVSGPLLGKKELEDTLNISFKVSDLSEYQQKVIAKSEIVKKPVFFEGLTSDRTFEMDIIEQPEQVVLCKRIR